MAKDKFKTGAVLVEFEKDCPYFDKIENNAKGVFAGTPIEALKDEPQFKKGQRKSLHYHDAGILAKAGYLSLLNEKYEKVQTSKAAKS